jgi:hypothetical protein
MYPRRHGAHEAYWRATTRALSLHRQLGSVRYFPEDVKPGAAWLREAEDYGYRRPKQPRDHRGRFTARAA